MTTNEMFSLTEVVTEMFTIEPDPQDIHTEQEFAIRFDRTPSHLLTDWGLIVLFGLVFGLGTALVLKRQDVG